MTGFTESVPGWRLTSPPWSFPPVKPLQRFTSRLFPRLPAPDPNGERPWL